MKITCLLICGLFLTGCNLRPSVRGNEGSLQTKSESVEETVPSDQAVDFEGVSFHYDPRVFGDVKKEVVSEHKLERPDDKPNFPVAPEHVRFDFDFGPEGAKARIAIYPLDKFDDAYAISPHWVKYINDEIAGLRKVLKDPSFRLDGEIPHLLYGDGGDEFYVRLRHFDFPSGGGVIFVTRWSIEAELISNQNLIYRFEGITSDGEYYVTAETPISVDFLPDTSPDEFEGYTWKDAVNSSTTGITKYEKYVKSITTRLEKLKPTDYSPNLEKFEAIISSLKIDK